MEKTVTVLYIDGRKEDKVMDIPDPVPEPEPTPPSPTVWDELAAAIMEGVNAV